MPDAYVDDVRSTFRSRALRTVLVIDDQFPTYADLLSEEGTPEKSDKVEEFTEAKRARELYQLFRSHHMPCDVENRVGEIEQDIERIRKSDLIVLDYHLTPGTQDTSKSLSLIRRLSQTKHFNTVVLYTRETDLEGVWLNVAFNLRGGWVEPDSILAERESALNTWEGWQTGNLELPAPTRALMAAYITGGLRKLPPEDRKALEAELMELGALQPDVSILIEALIHRQVREVLQDQKHQLGGEPEPITGGFNPEGPLWLQGRNCFVALLGKKDSNDEAAHPTDASRILDCLDEALGDWRPNLLQVIVSEMQNILELEALATDEIELRDPATHAGLSYYLLRSLEEDTGPNSPDRLVPPLQLIIDKLVETLRHRLASDAGLRDLATRLLTAELTRIGWPLTNADPKRLPRLTYEAACKLSEPKPKAAKNDALFALNSFLSTEPFRKGHLTTGTIFKHVTDGTFWICASPACDMVARTPSSHQLWSRAIHPMRAIIAVRLHEEVSVASALGEAEIGKHVFLRTDSDKAFSVVDKGVGQPVYEFLFPEDVARAQLDAEGRQTFTAFRVEEDSADEAAPSARRFSQATFEVVGQLRSTYAARVLQMVGQHLSRLGVDFVNNPT
jgi:hypothetical protein